VRTLILLLLFAAPAAHAQLYRWIDPQTGSVKFSNIPPAVSQPGVEVVPYRGPGAPGSPRPGASGIAELESRWRALLAELGTQDLARGGQGLQPQLQAYEAVRSELDRLDPAGAARRRVASASVMQRLARGLEVQK
jgi:hypothetical protein